MAFEKNEEKEKEYMKKDRDIEQRCIGGGETNWIA